MESVEWWLVGGLVLLSLGNLKQIWDEWPQRGLTDTSYSTLWLSFVGTVGIIAYAFMIHGAVLACVMALPGGIYLGMIVWKVRDFVRARFRL